MVKLIYHITIIIRCMFVSICLSAVYLSICLSIYLSIYLRYALFFLSVHISPTDRAQKLVDSSLKSYQNLPGVIDLRFCDKGTVSPKSEKISPNSEYFTFKPRKPTTNFTFLSYEFEASAIKCNASQGRLLEYARSRDGGQTTPELCFRAGQEKHFECDICLWTR